MKIAIVTDSNSGITQSRAKELGITVIPMPFMIDGQEYFEDISMTQDEFFEKIENGGKVVTSQPSPEIVMETWDKLLEEYDEIVHIPMSSGLSGSCQTAQMLSEDYDNKVFVVNNQRICPTQRDSVFDAMHLVEKGYDGAAIKAFLEKVKFDTTIYIMVGTLEYLKRGGRITPAVATIGNLLRLKPVLAIHGEKLDAHATVRTLSQGKTTLINSVKKDMENLIKDSDPDHYNISIAYTKSDKEALKFKEELIPVFGTEDIKVEPLSLSVACHIGPESLALAISKKIEGEV